MGSSSKTYKLLNGKDSFSHHVSYQDTQFLLKEKCNTSPKPTASDLNLQQSHPVRYQLDDEEIVVDDQIVQFDPAGRPVSLLDGGHHFNDCPNRRRPVENTSLPLLPRDYLMKIIKDGNYRRPPCKVHNND